MVLQFEGKITYKDAEYIEFEINETHEIKFKFTGDFQFEPHHHFGTIAEAIKAVETLLKTCSPKTFEMWEKEE